MPESEESAWAFDNNVFMNAICNVEKKISN